MKLVKTASGKQTIKMSKKEWTSIGKKEGWMKKAQEDDGLDELLFKNFGKPNREEWSYWWKQGYDGKEPPADDNESHHEAYNEGIHKWEFDQPMSTASKESKVVISAGKKCDSCEAVNVNGVRTHERGCPDAWKDYKEECKWCGSEFKPKEKGQKCCSKSCDKSYNS